MEDDDDDEAAADWANSQAEADDPDPEDWPEPDLEWPDDLT